MHLYKVKLYAFLAIIVVGLKSAWSAPDQAPMLDDYVLYSRQRPTGVWGSFETRSNPAGCLDHCRSSGLDCGMITFDPLDNTCYFYESGLARTLLSGTSDDTTLIEWPRDIYTYILKNLVFTESGITSTNSRASCRICEGSGYVGKVNTTQSGIPCQRWDANTPHAHGDHPSVRPDKNLQENYCRNPDGARGPWCYTTDPGTRWDYCRVDLCRDVFADPILPNITHTTDCYEGTGTNYRGQVSMTKSGRICMPWWAQFPHVHDTKPEDIPCSGLDWNYCRNPVSAKKEGPWCYTTDPAVRWELCEVPKCSASTEPTATQSTTTTSTTIGSKPKPALPKPSGTCSSPRIKPNIKPVSKGKLTGGIVSRILGGNNAVHGSWPWMASFRFYPNRHFCGGVLVKTRWILTAAHCVDDKLPRHFFIQMGHHIGTEPQAQTRTIERIVVHKNFIDATKKNDIALVKLSTPFVITDYVMPACLPQPGYIVSGGTDCVATGWGYTYDPHHNNALKQVILQVQSYAVCMRYASPRMRDRKQMCAGTPGGGQDTCRGDSGGPLACFANGRWVVQGLTSSGSYCTDRRGHYGSYTRISKYLGWIKHHTREH